MICEGFCDLVLLRSRICPEYISFTEDVLEETDWGLLCLNVERDTVSDNDADLNTSQHSCPPNIHQHHQCQT